MNPESSGQRTDIAGEFCYLNSIRRHELESHLRVLLGYTGGRESSESRCVRNELENNRRRIDELQRKLQST